MTDLARRAVGAISGLRGAERREVLDRLAEVERLADAGEHERASLRLYLSKGLCSPLPIEDFRAVFRRRDRVRLHELTDPLPGPGPIHSIAASSSGTPRWLTSTTDVRRRGVFDWLPPTLWRRPRCYRTFLVREQKCPDCGAHSARSMFGP